MRRAPWHVAALTRCRAVAKVNHLTTTASKVTVLMDEGGEPMRNVLGGALDVCGCDPMTGFTRSGTCETGPLDAGSHTVCASVTAEFLAFTAEPGQRPGITAAGLSRPSTGGSLVPLRKPLGGGAAGRCCPASGARRLPRACARGRLARSPEGACGTINGLGRFPIRQNHLIERKLRAFRGPEHLVRASCGPGCSRGRTYRNECVPPLAGGQFR